MKVSLDDTDDAKLPSNSKDRLHGKRIVRPGAVVVNLFWLRVWGRGGKEMRVSLADGSE